jgi:hypothetical protein
MLPLSQRDRRRLQPGSAPPAGTFSSSAGLISALPFRELGPRNAKIVPVADLPDRLALLGLLPQGGVLYLALDKFCGYSTRTTLKIMGGFIGLHLILSLIVSFLF